MYHLITITSDGTTTVLKQDKKPTLAQMQQLVGGYIQELPEFKFLTLNGQKPEPTKFRGMAYADEDDLMKGLAPNLDAKRAWQVACPTGDPSRMNLVGTILFISNLK